MIENCLIVFGLLVGLPTVAYFMSHAIAVGWGCGWDTVEKIRNRRKGE